MEHAADTVLGIVDATVSRGHVPAIGAYLLGWREEEIQVSVPLGVGDPRSCIRVPRDTC